jgi:hypothetical protein
MDAIWVSKWLAKPPARLRQRLSTSAISHGPMAPLELVSMLGPALTPTHQEPGRRRCWRRPRRCVGERMPCRLPAPEAALRRSGACSRWDELSRSKLPRRRRRHSRALRSCARNSTPNFVFSNTNAHNGLPIAR